MANSVEFIFQHSKDFKTNKPFCAVSDVHCDVVCFLETWMGCSDDIVSACSALVAEAVDSLVRQRVFDFIV